MIKHEGKPTDHKSASQNKTGRVEIASTHKRRHIIRFGPDWGDILVIEGNALDRDLTKDWIDKRGPQSPDVYNAWAKPEL